MANDSYDHGLPRSEEGRQAIKRISKPLRPETEQERLRRLLKGQWSLQSPKGEEPVFQVISRRDGVRHTDFVTLEEVRVLMNGPAWNLPLDEAAQVVEEGIDRDPRMHLIDQLLVGKAEAIRRMKR